MALRMESSPKKTIRLRHSRLIDCTKRSAWALQLGARAGVRTTRTPVCSRSSRNRSLNLVSRSQMNARLPSRKPSKQSVGFFATRTIQDSSGFRV